MKPRFRQSMNWLHTWFGFVFAWVLYFIFVTGSVGYFEDEIDHWLKPERVAVKQNIDTLAVLKNAEQQLNFHADDSPQWYVSYPTERSPFIHISWLQLPNEKNNQIKKWQEKNLHPVTGEPIEIRETAGARTLYRLHYNLSYIPHETAWLIISIVSMVLLVGLISGVIIHKKIFIEFFTFRPNKGLRSWIDIHNVLSVLPLPFYLMVTYSGLLLLMTVSMSPAIDYSYDKDEHNGQSFYKVAFEDVTQKQITLIDPARLNVETVINDVMVRYPNQPISYVGVLDRNSTTPAYQVWFDQFTGIEFVSSVIYQVKHENVELAITQGKSGQAAQLYDIFEHLHEGIFANIYLRWLYFISGLMGAGMIATGAIIWINKRKQKSDRKPSISMLYIIERLNVAFILGVPISIAVFFMSNRFIPVDFVNRAEWEIHSLFITLGLCVLYCVFKREQFVWLPMLKFAALAFMLLPLVNYLTSEHNIVSSFIHNNGFMLSLDLTAIFVGGCFAVAAFYTEKSRRLSVSFNANDYLNVNKGV